ncbi:hypothetical protein KGA65_18085 [Ideonella sp. B7]|uniref:hypothetical protein n=1 Tax=Ideonella benzenivorans TaxID=2831643 RepID=UPI001CEC0B48|nr:hypothetical protein [Ideonella benzenivorans]MCA6218451.1 hypothetical protein [Ideonella benzenivorans]
MALDEFRNAMVSAIRKGRWQAAAIALAVALILVTTPELRALLLLVQYFGVEATALLAVVALRSFSNDLAVGLHMARRAACPAVAATARLIARFLAASLYMRALRPLNTILVAVLLPQLCCADALPVSAGLNEQRS